MATTARVSGGRSSHSKKAFGEKEKIKRSDTLEYRRDYGFGFGGFLVGVALILLIFWYRGGFTIGSGPLSIFDFRSRQDPDTLATSTPIPVYDSSDDYNGSGQYTRPSQNGQTGSRNGRGRTGELRVRVSNLQMRRCPGEECQRIATLPLGANVALLGQRDFVYDQEWVRVRAGGQDGWVNRYYLE